MAGILSKILEAFGAPWFDRLVAIAREGDEQQVKQFMILACSALGAPQLAIWAGCYFYFGHVVPGLILLAYAAVTLAAVAVACANFDYAKLCNHVVLVLIFAVNIGISFYEGGLIDSNGQFVWAFLAPMGMLIISSRLVASLWMIAFNVAVVALAAIPAISSNSTAATAFDDVLSGMNVVCVSSFIFYALSYYVAKKDAFYSLLKQEEAKSESLLLNVLPSDIAAELKAGASRIAQRIEEATILFIDLVGFTQISAGQDAGVTVEMLNTIFTEFDQLALRHGVEKIKTIGDCYMAAAGVPGGTRPDHASAAVALALDMGEALKRCSHQCGLPLEFRAGIHSGPVSAGVIGLRKFAFDVWGDTVNTASRMESHGVPGRVQISGATYCRVSDAFECEPRGKIEIKGKGLIETWLVVQARNGGSHKEALRLPSNPSDFRDSLR
jgi:guanylate cyclase